MELFIPAELQKMIVEFEEEGAEWLRLLPERIATLEREWGFRTGPALDHGGCVSWVAPVLLKDGSDAILKIGLPSEESIYEADALRLHHGEGAIRLLNASEDRLALLLERCIPGNDLWSLSVEEADTVAAHLLPRLWKDPGSDAPYQPLTDLVAHWCTEMPQILADGLYDAELAAKAHALGSELAATQPKTVWLHGDFHPGNVLAAQREPWLMIDPKPLVGDPAYDLAQWLGNRYDAALLTPDPVGTLRHQIRRFSERLALDPKRIAGWAFVKALGWDWGQESFALFDRVRQGF